MLQSEKIGNSEVPKFAEFWGMVNQDQNAHFLIHARTES